MTLAEEFAAFADTLRQGRNGMMSELSLFPSGALGLRVHLTARRVFDLEYLPSHGGFFVGELPSDAAFDTGHRFRYPDFASAKGKLLDLLGLEKEGN